MCVFTQREMRVCELKAKLNVRTAQRVKLTASVQIKVNDENPSEDTGVDSDGKSTSTSPPMTGLAVRGEVESAKGSAMKRLSIFRAIQYFGSRTNLANNTSKESAEGLRRQNSEPDSQIHRANTLSPPDAARNRKISSPVPSAAAADFSPATSTESGSGQSHQNDPSFRRQNSSPVASNHSNTPENPASGSETAVSSPTTSTKFNNCKTIKSLSPPAVMPIPILVFTTPGESSPSAESGSTVAKPRRRSAGKKESAVALEPTGAEMELTSGYFSGVAELRGGPCRSAGSEICEDDSEPASKQVTRSGSDQFAETCL